MRAEDSGDARSEPLLGRGGAQPAYSVYRARLPRDRAYPLTRGELDAALDAAGVGQVSHVHFSRNRSDGVVVEAVFMGEALSWTGRPARFARDDGTVTIIVYSVATQHRRDAKAALQQEGLPALCEWLRRVESAGNVWRSTMHHVCLRYEDDALSIEES